jgi:hypothetical protein
MERIKQTFRDGAAAVWQWYLGYRAHILAFLALMLGLLELVDPYALAYVLPERWAAIAPMALGFAVFLLRKLVTNDPPAEPLEQSTEEYR